MKFWVNRGVGWTSRTPTESTPEYTVLILSTGMQGWANSVDPDLIPQNAVSDQDLYGLPLIQQF